MRVGLSSSKRIGYALGMEHPGLVIERGRQTRGLSKTDLARRLGVSVQYVSDVTKERRGISVALAISLERVLGSPASYWLGLQTEYDLHRARERVGITR